MFLYTKQQESSHLKAKLNYLNKITNSDSEQVPSSQQEEPTISKHHQQCMKQPNRRNRNKRTDPIVVELSILIFLIWLIEAVKLAILLLQWVKMYWTDWIIELLNILLKIIVLVVVVADIAGEVKMKFIKLLQHHCYVVDVGMKFHHFPRPHQSLYGQIL